VSDPIATRLRALDRALRVPRRLRRRILTEAEDHLREAASRDGADAAVAAFGDVAAIARGFHEQLATRAARRAAAVGCLAAAVAVAVVGLTAQSTVAILPAQLAAVAAAVAALRVLRHRRATAVPAGSARLIRNGVLLAAAACAPCAAGAPLAAIPALPALAAAILAHRRVRALDPDGEERVDGLADLPMPLLPQLLRRHPWRTCAAVALAAGLAAAAGHGIADGGSQVTLARVPLALAAGAIIAGIEAAAVTACYAVFGRWLGLR
jgi:hypothetical protein